MEFNRIVLRFCLIALRLLVYFYMKQNPLWSVVTRAEVDQLDRDIRLELS
jgi:hypothetical protein